MDRQGYARCIPKFRVVSTLLPCFLVNSSVAAPNVLNRTTHADSFIGAAVNATVGSGVVDQSIQIDYDTNLPLQDLSHPSDTTFSVESGAQVNHAPYTVANYSVCCSAGLKDEINYFQQLTAANAILVSSLAIQVGGLLPARTAPPICCSNASSPNSGNGGTGWGIEFGLSASYLGLDTTEDSWDTAILSGLLAALKYQHPSWTWFDIKAALRQTADNWSTGYSHLAFGYGLINWTAANAIATASALYLQPPGVLISLDETTATIQLFPFRQTRRKREAVYAVDPGYSWPVGKNELSAADLAAAGARHLFTSNGTDLIATFTVDRLGSQPWYFIAFTTDDAGNFSRVEEFSVQKIADRGIADVPIPSWAPLSLSFVLLLTLYRARPAALLSSGLSGAAVLRFRRIIQRIAVRLVQ